MDGLLYALAWFAFVAIVQIIVLVCYHVFGEGF